MKLEQIVAEIRPRQPREAVDLGFTLAKHWWKDLFRIQLLSSLIALIPCLIIGFFLNPFLVFSIFWWLRPLIDRWGLAYASQAMFGSEPKINELARQQLKQTFSYFFRGFLLDRLDPRRSMMMPVAYLERVRGKRLAKRRRVVAQYGGDIGCHVTAWCSSFEAILFMGGLIYVWMMMPRGMEVTGEALLWSVWNPAESTLNWFAWMNFFLWVVITLIISPFYITAGFALYLNSRSHQEGWDIEIVFRRLAQRINEKKANQQNKLNLTGKLKGGLVIGLLFTAMSTSATSALNQPLHAQPEVAENFESNDEGDGTPESEIQQILASETFEKKKIKVRHFEFDWDTNNKPQNTNTNNWGFDAGLSSIMKALALTILAVLIIYFIYLIVRQLGNFKSNRIPTLPKTKAPEPVVEEVMAQIPLPEDLPNQVLLLWQAGKHIEALSLLYRGTLHRVSKQFDITFATSDTEYECRRRVRQLNQPWVMQYVDQMMKAWLDLRYAGRKPDFEEIRHLCRQWPFENQTPHPAQVVPEKGETRA